MCVYRNMSAKFNSQQIQNNLPNVQLQSLNVPLTSYLVSKCLTSTTVVSKMTYDCEFCIRASCGLCRAVS